MANSRSSSPASSRSSVQPDAVIMSAPEQETRPSDDIQPCPVGYMAHTPPPGCQQPAASISSSGCSSSMAGYPTREELAVQQQQLEQQAIELRQREERLHEQWQQMQMLPPPSNPPAKKERKLPIRSGSTASLFSPFASLSRRLGAKHKASKTSGSMASGMAPSPHSRMSTPVEYANCPPVNERPSLASIYSTFPRKHHSSSSSASSGRAPFISQLVSHAGSGSSTTTGHCPSCPSPGPSYSSSSRVSSAAPIMMTEVLDEPAVEEEGAGERVTWEYHHVTMNRVPGYGFGIAVSGGRDNPHFANGDPSIAISDVIKGGPAEGKLLINDRVMSVNGISLENVDYGTAVSVLRDSGAVVSLVVKRRIVLAACHEPITYKVTLTKSKKKDDFGVILGSRIYLKELTNRALIERDGPQSAAIQEGDVVLKINSTPTEGMSLKEARKLMENCKDKLQLTIRREPGVPTVSTSTSLVAGGGAVGGGGGGGPTYDATYGTKEAPGHFANYADRPNYCNQNLYVQPPTRGGSVDYRNPLTPQPPLPMPPPPHNGCYGDDKTGGNLSRLGGRSRGPVVDVSLSQLDHHHHHMNGHGPDEADAPPRPPPPRSDDYYSPRRPNEPPAEPIRPPPTLEPRFITFQKEGSVGIRLTGGNQVGIFVTAVQPGSPAAVQGLVPGDKILKVNDMEMSGVTREEAVLFLLSLQDLIELVVQHKRDEYDQVVASGHGDSFYVKTHFNYEQPASGHMSFRKGEVFHVVDTLYKGVVGAWQAYRVGPNGQDLQQGVIPNSAAAEELATAQFNAAKKEAATTTSESRGSFFRRRRPTHRRSKSLGRDHWDDVVFAETLSKFPAYERVVLRHPGFIRPVVMFGPIADIAREKLIKDFPDKFSAPQMDGCNRDSSGTNENGGQVAGARSGIVRLSAIRELVDKGRHALLDITPGAVDKLNYAQFYPVVIFLRADSKHTVKELRAGTPNPLASLAPRLDELLKWTAHKSSKKLYEQCVKLEKLWSHAFTTTVPLTQRDTWYRKLREAIDREQNQAIWVSEAKLDEYLSDDFLFPMTSRLSYASSPESDIDLSPEPRPTASAKLDASNGRKSPASPAANMNSSRLVKSSSDPSICTQDDLGVSGNTSASGGGLLSTVSPKFLTQMSGVSLISAVETSTPSKRRSHGGDSKYGFSSPINGAQQQQQQQRESNTPRSPRSSSYNGYQYNGRQQDYVNGSHQPTRSMGSNNGYPPPPPPAQQQQHQQHYGYQQQQQYGANGSSINGNEVPPPKIDRSSKPRGGNHRSAQERLFGSRDGDMNEMEPAYPTSPPGPAPPNGGGGPAASHPPHDYLGSMRAGSLDRAAKAGSYDSSSSSYESYNRLGLTLGGLNQQQHQPSDPGALPGSPSASMANKSHDPYRYTRSTSQPVRSPAEPTSPATKQHIRPFEPKKPSPPPPPKTAPYKPVPPPKPKNYRPPPNAAAAAAAAASSASAAAGSSQPTSAHQPVTSNSNYWNHSPPGTLSHAHRTDSSSANGQHANYYAGPPNGVMHNGGHYNRYDDDPNGGFDSGHGSSLDRHSYGGGPNSLYSKAPPPPPPPVVNGSRSQNNQTAGQYYYNIPPPRDQASRDAGRLDLAQHRDQRGSAFELYKKPSDPRSPGHAAHQLYMEHNARTLDYYNYWHDGDGSSRKTAAAAAAAHFNGQQERPPSDYYYSPPTSPPPPNCAVIATVRGWLAHEQGGRLESVETGVALIVPPGALPPSLEPHLVYFKVCRQDNNSDDAKGEAVLSPLVQCGPKGLRFLKPVELRIPHQAKSGRWNVSLKASNELGQWRQISQPGDERPDSDDAKYSRNYLSAFVDHF